MLSLSSVRLSNKGQFLIITAFVIVSIFYMISRWMEPYTIPDTAEVVLMDEPFIFNDIKKQALKTVNTSKSCAELVDNLDEFKTYVEDYSFERLIIYLDYTIETPCYEYDPEFPILVFFDMSVESQNIKISDEFYGFWPSETTPL